MQEDLSDQMADVLKRYLALCESRENQRNRRFWANADAPWLIERWRGISATPTGAFTMALDMAGYATVLGIVRPYVEAKGVSAARAYFSGNAARVYGVVA